MHNIVSLRVYNATISKPTYETTNAEKVQDIDKPNKSLSSDRVSMMTPNCAADDYRSDSPLQSKEKNHLSDDDDNEDDDCSVIIVT
jgi:hypothetical protein